MNRARSMLCAALAALPPMTIACKSGGSSTPPPPPPPTVTVTCTNGTMIANEANDYAFSSMIKLSPVSVTPMSNLTFDWSGITTDFLGQPVNPKTDLTTIFLLLVRLPAATFELQLNNDSFATSSIAITPPPQFNPPAGVTSANLFTDFTAGGEPITAANADPYLDATMYMPTNSTFAIVAQTGTSLGTDIRMLQSFELDPSSTNTTVTFTNSSTMLQYTANLHSLDPTGVPAGTAALTLDWSQLNTNALGEDITQTRTNIGNAIVGHYSQTPAELESKFLDLQTIAEDLYTATIASGTVLDFTTLVDSKGNSFQGIDSTGTWLVGLICSNCRNPAPWYLTVLEPVTQPCSD
jgi:hypothetical protein